MSDIDDILNEFGSSAPSGQEGVARYIPDPAEFGKSYNEQTQQGWEGMKSAGSDIYNQGLSPTNAFQAAMAGLQYLASPFTAFGSYLGGPVERGVSDVTGSPTAGKVIGDTVALAPSLVMPFPGAKSLGAAAETGGAMIGEAQAARSVADNVIPYVASKFAPAAAARSDIDEILEEGATRTTTKGKSIEDELALKWYQDQFKGGVLADEVPPLASAPRKTIRMLNKGDPKVGERTYAGDKEQSHVMPYQNQGERPTYRTGAQAAEPTREYPPVWDEGGYPMTNLGTIRNSDPAPLLTYENAFRREFEPGAVELGSQPSQQPLLPGRNPALADMYLPNVRENAEIDPNLLAELKLKYGAGSPAGNKTSEPWMSPSSGDVRNPSNMPIPGAQPMPSQNTVVQFPSENMPVPMGIEARGNTNRLRGDLGLPPDSKEALRGKPPIPDNPGTPAKPGISNYGEVVVGQPYDIVHAVGANEMRAPGGIVKEMVDVNEPVIKNGKMTYEPAVYGILEDGRKVPAKMLKPAGAQQPNVSAMGKSAPRSASTVSAPAASSEATADPAFEKLRAQMQAKVDALAPTSGKPGGPQSEVVNKRTYDAKDIASVIKAIKDSRPTADAPVYYSELKEKIPGVSKAMLDRAYSKIKEKNPAIRIFTHTEKGPYLSLDKTMASKIKSQTTKTETANSAVKIATEDGKLKQLYLRNMRPHIIQNKNKDLEVSEASMIKHLNRMLKDGEIKVYPEDAPNKPLTKITEEIFGGDPEDDYIVKFLKSKKPKADK